MLNLLLNLLLTIIGIIIGGTILLGGRRWLWVTLGIVAAAGTANLLAAFFISSNSSGWDIVVNRDWLLLVIALAAGLVGYVLGRNYLDTAVAVIGFIAGASAALWFIEIIYYIVAQVEGVPDSAAAWLIMVVLIAGGTLGLMLTRHFPEDALILISVYIGVDIIGQTLDLKPSGNLTALIMLSLGLVGMVVQYADYLRQLKSQTSFFGEIVTQSEVPMTEHFDL
ncbi:MAG: hypothetical protein KDE48_02805 [Anaerolineales bacterium]|nr:hypothetical protein [Anaerolineales bacterium]